MEVSRLKLDHVAWRNYVHVLQSTLRLKLGLICAHGSKLVSDYDTARITPKHALNLDDIEDNASEPTWSGKGCYKIF